MLARLLLVGILVTVCSTHGSAQVREEVRLKMADGSYLVVDEATETAQGIWYKQGSLSNLLPKSKVKKIERITPPAPDAATAPLKSTNDDDHFEITPEVTVEAAPKSGNYDQPVWIYLKGGARVEADSASESPAGAWYKRGGMSMFIDRSRINRIDLEAPKPVAPTVNKETAWSAGPPGLDRLIRVNGSTYTIVPYSISLVVEQDSHFTSYAVSPTGARGLT